ncbi:hypothetical protein A3F02_01335 [Candidatus Curtissbacteria bacterium RIFCSPHIGHO2_12_FULL_38_9b]|uniref:Uncharacterized protein n=1 Tax=Candidatus Curtissbacteria bacterium RIFCSPHIGHO2_12_FULL_38_9b TaxID=1797720 RepID=A0A1F5GZW7_9BACT|nr:MAG: hypothetical protein A3F02_01335 [Candidatus Curtissbacteria bacterium RIFCSPHIGHO2_12_FULL_38_9b]
MDSTEAAESGASLKPSALPASRTAFKAFAHVSWVDPGLIPFRDFNMPCSIIAADYIVTMGYLSSYDSEAWWR